MLRPVLAGTWVQKRTIKLILIRLRINKVRRTLKDRSAVYFLSE